jgi:hypothetical protein
MKVGFDKLVTLYVLSIKNLDLYFATVEPGCDNFLIKRRITFGNKNKNGFSVEETRTDEKIFEKKLRSYFSIVTLPLKIRLATANLFDLKKLKFLWHLEIFIYLFFY